MKKVLAVIDMQNDFIDGSLGTKEAELIVQNVCDLIRSESWDRVFATMDTHGTDYLESFEGKHLPVSHCIRDTEGWQINEEVMKALKEKDAVIVEKPTFGSLRLPDLIKAEEPDEITICGLCTDICVISNALMLRAALPDTVIKADAKACAGTAAEAHEAALTVMKSCQIEVI